MVILYDYWMKGLLLNRRQEEESWEYPYQVRALIRVLNLSTTSTINNTKVMGGSQAP